MQTYIYIYINFFLYWIIDDYFDIENKKISRLIFLNYKYYIIM